MSPASPMPLCLMYHLEHKVSGVRRWGRPSLQAQGGPDGFSPSPGFPRGERLAGYPQGGLLSQPEGPMGLLLAQEEALTGQSLRAGCALYFGYRLRQLGASRESWGPPCNTSGDACWDLMPTVPPSKGHSAGPSPGVPPPHVSSPWGPEGAY